MNAMRVSLRRLFQFASRLSPRRPPQSSTTAIPETLANPTACLDSERIAALRGQRRLYIDLTQDQVERMRDLWPEQVAATIQAADAIRRHEFNLLGSGPYIPLDHERFVEGSSYRPIDWRLDPVSGQRFPAGMPHREWDFQKMTPPRADIKLPWELARCQHWVTLAQAFRLSGEAPYAVEIADQLNDFIEQNPIGRGINWVCTMDVALRAVSWSLSFELIKRSNVLGDSFWTLAYRQLFEHGVFIRNNLEDHYEVTSNHFLSNIVGLFYLSHVFQETPAGREWEEFSRVMLEREIQTQVLPDGADFESSIAYHRLVCELFLGAARLAEFGRQPLSEGLCAVLRRMIAFMVALMRPDGLMPLIGDADDGRLHIFTDYGKWHPQDARHLLAPAALLLGETSWLRHASDAGAWEAHWWGFEPPLALFRSETPAEGAHLFPDAGLAVARRGGDYLVITNGAVGTKGFGNHKHNDLLSFEYHPAGIPLVVDPGSYVYTSDAAARNVFRSTKYHNTLMVDDVEQNEINPDWLFRLFEKASPETLEYRMTGEAFIYRGRHIGYTRLQNSVTHERRFELMRTNGTLSITDRIEGSGPHKLNWHFHLAPTVEVMLENGGIRLFQIPAGVHWQLSVSAAVRVSCSSAWYSPSYGVRIPCQAIDLEAEIVLPRDALWNFTLTKIG